ncbi:MAG: glycosyltransferase [Candidatus Omnitrophota bacterium]
MFSTILIYILIIVLIFWVYSGYVLMLYALIIVGKRSGKASPEGDHPSVSILVPCHNEASFVKEKVKNLEALDYPKDKLKIIFLDGNSNDGTFDILSEEIKDLSCMELAQTGCRGKINQLNHILPKIDSQIIVNTDMDTMLNADILKEMTKVFKEDSDIYVVGAHVIPKSHLSFEREYWYLQNRIRFLESKVYCSSIVAAPCYAFKKGLIKSFPKDCVADDIYISFYANTKGKKTKYAEKAIAYEMRFPDRMVSLLQHKFRKGNAYITELLRFVYLLPYMNLSWKVIFLTKFLQVIVLPWVLPFFLISSVSMFLEKGPALLVFKSSMAFLLGSFLTVHFLFIKGRKAAIGTGKNFPFHVFIITNAILLLDSIGFPFYRQTSSYEKVDSKR